jgi:cell division protease FtsH
VRRLIDEAYQSARTIIDANRDPMHRIAAALLERETIDADEVKMLIEGKELPPMRSVLASPSDGSGGTPQQVLKPESRGGSGSGIPEGSPSPA